MAETVVGLVIDKLVPLLGQEAYLLRGVHTQVEAIKCDLDFLMAFLNDADTKAEDSDQSKSHGVRIWVQRLRNASFELEDVIDDYTHLMARHRSHSQGTRFVGFLRESAFLIVKLKTRRGIAAKIRNIKRRIGDINDKSRSFGFNSLNFAASSNGKWADPRKDACFLEENEVVGIESERDDLVKRLLESEPKRRSVISLVGMGGVGKTTLAHQVYERAKGNFECHAWVEVSQSYSRVDLLRSLIKKICLAREEFVPLGIEAMDEQAVTTELRLYLRGKRYIVFFDDVWNVGFWSDIKNALPENDDDNNDKCGKIVITTRYVEVANFCKTSVSCVHIHHLKLLSNEKSWQLFCKKAFHSEPDKKCPVELKELSLKITNRCCGLPLAIVVIAGLLSTKNKSVIEWKNLETCIVGSELDSNEHLTSITRILSLSYNDLPYYPKSCFLYFGIFPEDCSVRHGRLIRQWIAEGFVKPRKGKTLEMVAEEYLAELINRSLVQVSKVKFDGKAKYCRVHDVLREIILKKVQDLSFCQTSSQNCSESRRLSFFDGSYSSFQHDSKSSRARSVFVFSGDGIMINQIMVTMVKSFKLLKLLDFENASRLSHLPKEIGALFHLKYLSLRGTRVKFLPRSIGKLENLETLDLKRSRIYTLPIEIERLRKLRHLLAYHIGYNADSLVGVHKGVKINKGIGSLSALQKLYFIEANAIGFDVFEELEKLTELRKLGIKMLRSEDGKRLCDCIKKMERLESLSLASQNEHETIKFETLSSKTIPRFLRHLNLDCRLEKLPEWIQGLQNLVRLRLGWSKLKEDPLKALQKLPNILELGMYYNAYHGEGLHFERESFLKLKVLCLGDLSQLRSVTIDEGALRGLERFLIGSCPKLEQVPVGVQNLRSLKVIGFIEMPLEFLMFQDFRSLQNVPNVRFAHITDGEYTAFGLDSITMIQNIMREHNEVEWELSHFEELLKHNEVEWEYSHFEEILSKVLAK